MSQSISKNHPPLILISGPSGAGEDSVIDAIIKHFNAARIVTVVTRKKRKNETEGKDYYFTTPADFKKRMRKDEFIEWARVYDDYRGATHMELERLFSQDKSIIWKMDWQGVGTVKKLFPESLGIVITPPHKDVAILTERLKKRGEDSWEEIKKREVFSAAWMEHLDVYDHIIENKEGKLQETIDNALHIIQKHFF